MNQDSSPFQPTIAVLPFSEPGLDGAEAHVREGLSEEILLALSRLDGLRVLSRTSSFRFQESNWSPEGTGEHLGVRYLLHGELARTGNRFRFWIRLLDIPAKRLIWEQHSERDHLDVLGLREEIAETIAKLLGLEYEALDRVLPLVDYEAYDAYLRGRQCYFQYHRQAMDEARQMFLKALDQDPTFAAAWAGLAMSAAYRYTYVSRNELNRKEAEEGSRKALELDPDLGEAYASRGVALSALGEAEAAAEAFETALELDPMLYEAAYLYARHCFAQGMPEMAIQFFERAALIRPEDCQPILLVAQVYHSLGIEDEAAAARRKGLALAEEQLRWRPEDARTLYLGANALVALGEKEKGLAWAQKARELDPEDAMLLYNLGCIFALAKEVEIALDCIEQGVAAGLSEKAWLLHDGDLDEIRSHSRFQALLQKMG